MQFILIEHHIITSLLDEVIYYLPPIMFNYA